MAWWLDRDFTFPVWTFISTFNFILIIDSADSEDANYRRNAEGQEYN